MNGGAGLIPPWRTLVAIQNTEAGILKKQVGTLIETFYGFFYPSFYYPISFKYNQMLK